MLGEIKPNQQQNASQIGLTELINLAHLLVKLACELDWNKMKLGYFGHHPKRKKKAVTAGNKLRTIGKRVVRELGRKLSEAVLKKGEVHNALLQGIVYNLKLRFNKIKQQITTWLEVSRTSPLKVRF